MTRARKRLSLSLARCRSLFGELRFNVPSRFVRELPDGLTEGLAALERLSPMQERARKDVFYDDFDQRPRYRDDNPLPARNKMRESRHDPASKGMNRKLVVRFGPGVGLKKVLARFIDPA
jgi:DNA helicase-2/ATP-dependent DNA helicase PcrA